jgi:23S rRNA (adenine2503-C2)-methyltransferase
LDAAALAGVLAEEGEPSWRADQIVEAIYHQYIREISSITTLSLDLRRKLAARGRQIGRPEITKAFQSADGTERYLVQCSPGDPTTPGGPATVETVWMPDGDDGEAGDGSSDETKDWRRATICVSSQVGCAVNCQFCLTAKLGLQRNLTAGEIAGQIVAVLDRHGVRVGRDRVNLVFMTVSTSGVVPGIERFANEPPDIRPKLAISLNAPNDEIRAEIMPINRKWPISSVIDAVRRVRLRPHERITFEYVLLGGVTDWPEHALEVARLVRRTGLPAKVNLIAWNPGPQLHYTSPKPETAEQFQKALTAEGIPTYIRQPRGRDIFAACGQLKRTVEA